MSELAIRNNRRFTSVDHKDIIDFFIRVIFFGENSSTK